jgi:hypothetical protein
MDHPRDEKCCLPGDITITPIPRGYMIGRALEQIGPGPWWEYIRIVKDLEVALTEARALASAAMVRAWMHEGGETYTEINRLRSRGVDVNSPAT